MKCIFPNNHVVAVIDNKNYVVDLGSPVSFSFDGSGAVIINGIRYRFTCPIIPTRKSDVDMLTGADITGFIGTDILARTGLTVSRKDGTVDFSFNRDEWDGASSLQIHELRKLFLTYVAAGMDINGTHVADVILDTGACIPYVCRNYLRDADRTGETYEDFNPDTGEIRGEFYNVSVVTGAGTRIVLKAGEMPSKLAALGIQAIINPMEFATERLGMDMAGGLMHYR